ncbi:MAG: ketol-acid reductoisomerase [Gammaproteobacteria bacterium]|nr:ketol-acid reductoisomerase [Gammaproteobacteria bacterium]
MGIIGADELRGANLGDQMVAVLGYGSQGRAQALNLADSGVQVVVGLRPGSANAARVQRDGLRLAALDEAVEQADLVALLIPDEAQPEAYEQVVAPRLRQGGALVFAHGFNIHYRHIHPRADLDALLVAPSGIGEQLRARYEAGNGIAGFVAVDQDATGQARARALAFAKALGHDRVAVIETTFAEETETDLFAEQAVLVGGLSELIEAGFETLVEAGYQPEIAYFSCLEEVKLMADMIHERGLADMKRRISTTAAFGALLSGPRVIDRSSRAAMRELLADIAAGRFAQALSAEMAAGGPRLEAEAARARAHPLEAVRRRLRGSRPRE